MPYKSIDELPSSIKDNLPKHAQEIYKEAYNNATKQYKDKSKRNTDESLEEISRKVAWNAVKQAYHKDAHGHWVKGQSK